MTGFSEWFANEMQRRKLTTRSFAKLIGMSPVSVSRWARGDRVPDIESCQHIAHGLQISDEVVLEKAGHRERQATMRSQLEHRLAELRSTYDALSTDLQIIEWEHYQIELEIRGVEEQLKSLGSKHPSDFLLEVRLREALRPVMIPEKAREEVVSRVLGVIRSEGEDLSVEPMTREMEEDQSPVTSGPLLEDTMPLEEEE
jgi:transcriptional regulator with XRE-family HTH domain